MIADSTKVIVPAIKWVANNYKFIFQLIKVLSDNLSLCKNIWLRVRERVIGTNKIKCYQDTVKKLFLEHEVYGFYIQNKRKGI